MQARLVSMAGWEIYVLVLGRNRGAFRGLTFCYPMMLSSRLLDLLPRDGHVPADIPRVGLVVSTFLSLSTISILAVALSKYALPLCDRDTERAL